MVCLDAQIETAVSALESGEQWLDLGNGGRSIRRRPVGGWDYIEREKDVWPKDPNQEVNKLSLAVSAGLMVSGPQRHRSNSQLTSLDAIKRRLTEKDCDGVQPIPADDLKTLEQMHQTTVEHLAQVEAGALCIPLMEGYRYQPPVVQLVIHAGSGFFLVGVNTETQQLGWCRAVNREGAYITTRWATHRWEGPDDSAIPPILEVEPWLREAADTFLRPDAFFDWFCEGVISVDGGGKHSHSPESLYPVSMNRPRKLRWIDSVFGSEFVTDSAPLSSRPSTAEEMRSLLENGMYHWVSFDGHRAIGERGW